MKIADPKFSRRCAAALNWYVNQLVAQSEAKPPAERATYVITQRNTFETACREAPDFASLPRFAQKIIEAAEDIQ